ncbi:MAG: DUF4153 domain-containing protein [Jhaorihella sp.]
MPPSQNLRIVLRRVAQVGLGGAAGLALWALVGHWDEPAMPPALYPVLFVFLLVQAGTALALAGPLRTARALTGALILALPVAALTALAGRRYLKPSDLLDDPVLLAVLAVLVFFSAPFLSVGLRRRTDWRRYEALFQSAWTITMRYGAAWVFVAVFWALALLSARLLGLVGIDALETALAVTWVRFVLTGAMLGMGLAVAYELREAIGPFLVLRLLRLLVPPVLAVVALFLAAVPFRGLGRLFGEFSAAGLLMATSMVAITLISSALDRNDTEAVSTSGLRAATRALALLLPPLAGLAVWAVVLRVAQYGWTPDRVLAGCVAAFLLAYGLGYGGAAAAGRGWAARIRAVNVAMALAVIAGAALWLTPVLDAYRISAASQVARYADGRAHAPELPLWDLAHDWGRAGRAGLERLEVLAARADDNALKELVERAGDQADMFHYLQAVDRLRLPLAAAELARLLPVRPEGAGPDAAALATLPAIDRDQWLRGCRHSLPGGRPGCVMVLGDFAPVPGAGVQGIVLFLDDEGRARGNHVMLSGGGEASVRVIYDPVADTWPLLTADVIARAQDGDFAIAPSGGHALLIGNAVLVPAR